MWYLSGVMVPATAHVGKAEGGRSPLGLVEQEGLLLCTQPYVPGHQLLPRATAVLKTRVLSAVLGMCLRSLPVMQELLREGQRCQRCLTMDLRIKEWLRGISWELLRWEDEIAPGLYGFVSPGDRMPPALNTAVCPSLLRVGAEAAGRCMSFPRVLSPEQRQLWRSCQPLVTH